MTRGLSPDGDPDATLEVGFFWNEHFQRFEYPRNYFAQVVTKEGRRDLRALMMGLEVKDMFIEANRPIARPRGQYMRGEEARSMEGHVFPEKHARVDMDIARPRKWHRP